MSIFSIQNRVYYEDTDAGGIVYHANYLKYMERARTEWVRSIGLEQNKLLEQSMGFVVIDMSLKYRRSAKLDDLLQTSVEIIKLKRASILFQQVVRRVCDTQNTHNDNNKDSELVTAQVKVACVNTKLQQPVAIPPDIFRDMRSDV